MAGYCTKTYTGIPVTGLGNRYAFQHTGDFSNGSSLGGQHKSTHAELSAVRISGQNMAEHERWAIARYPTRVASPGDQNIADLLQQKTSTPPPSQQPAVAVPPVSTPSIPPHEPKIVVLPRNSEPYKHSIVTDQSTSKLQYYQPNFQPTYDTVKPSERRQKEQRSSFQLG